MSNILIPMGPYTAYEPAGADFGVGPGTRSIPEGTRVRVTTSPRPECSVGVVSAQQWNTRGGCLVQHDDGAIYGWDWKELEEECLERVPLTADLMNIYSLDAISLRTLKVLEPTAQEQYLHDLFQKLYSGLSNV